MKNSVIELIREQFPKVLEAEQKLSAELSKINVNLKFPDGKVHLNTATCYWKRIVLSQAKKEKLELKNQIQNEIDKRIELQKVIAIMMHDNGFQKEEIALQLDISVHAVESFFAEIEAKTLAEKA